MIDVKTEFPSRLKKAREKRNITQQELCKIAGTSSIAQFETGARLPNAENIVKLALALKVSTDNLLGMPDYGIYLDMLTNEQTETVGCLIRHWLGVKDTL